MGTMRHKRIGLRKNDSKRNYDSDKNQRCSGFSFAMPKHLPLMIASLLTLTVAQPLLVGGSVAVAETKPLAPPVAPPSMQQGPTLLLSEINSPAMLSQALTMHSERDRVDADHREVDAMAERIKEMIEARYRAEMLLFKDAKETMAALRQRITDLEQQLENANGNYAALLAERDGLNQQLSLMQAERDSARDDVKLLAGEIENQQDAVARLREDVASAADQLTRREAKVNDLSDKLGVQQASGEQLEGSLTATVDKLKDKGRQLALAEERLADTRQQRDNLRSQLADLKTDKNNALNEIASLRLERDTADQRANGFMSERDNLTGKLGLFQSRSDDINSELKAEQQQHAETRAAVASLEDDIESLQGAVDAASKHRDELLAQKATLEGEKSKLTAELDNVNGQLQFASNELEARQSELQTANGEFEDVSGQLNVAKAELEDLNGQLASANDEIGKLNSHIGKLDNKVARLTSDHDKARASISSLKSNGSTLQQQLALAQTDLKSEKGSLQKQIDRRDRDMLQLNGRVSELVAELSALSEQSEGDVKGRDTKISALEAQLAQLRATKKRLLAEAKRSTDTMENLHNLIASLEKKEKATADKMAALQNQYAALQGNGLDEVDDLQKQLSESDQKLRIASEKLNAMLMEKKTLEAERDAVFSEAEKLRLALTDELRAAKLENVTVQKARSDNSIPLRLGNADFFAIGSAELTEEGGENLKKLAEIISTFQDRRIVVEGHTDNVQIGYRLKSVYATNWELSVARAAAAVRHMQYQSNIDPHQLSAVGYGEYAPVASNDSIEGRQLNRRVEVVLYPREVTEEQFSAMEE